MGTMQVRLLPTTASLACLALLCIHLGCEGGIGSSGNANLQNDWPVSSQIASSGWHKQASTSASYKVGVDANSASPVSIFTYTNQGEVLAVLGPKDAHGMPTAFYGAAYVSPSGGGATVYTTASGMPEHVEFSSGLEIDVLGYELNVAHVKVTQLNGDVQTGTLTLDAEALQKLIVAANKVNTGKADGLFDAGKYLDIAGLAISVFGCGVSIAAATATGGAAIPLAFLACGSLALKAYSLMYADELTGTTATVIDSAICVGTSIALHPEVSSCLSALTDVAVAVVKNGGGPTCASSCGGMSQDHSCWCDSKCAQYGDCCDDVCDECGGCGSKGTGDACDNVTCNFGYICLKGGCVLKSEQTSCDDNCCEGQDDDCKPAGAQCFCDEACVKYDDCCSDSCSVCGYCK